MKKFFFLFAVLFTFTQLGLKAQTDFDNVIFNLDLVAVFDIEVTTGDVQNIVFNTSDQWNNGTWETNGIATGNSEVTVNATSNWDMTITAPDFSPTGGGASGNVPITNLGFWIENLGSYVGTESNWDAVDAGTAQGMTASPELCIWNQDGNMGDATNNWFRFNWRMGTMDAGNPRFQMNALSMLQQLTAGTFTLGQYTTTAVLTINPAP